MHEDVYSLNNIFVQRCALKQNITYIRVMQPIYEGVYYLIDIFIQVWIPKQNITYMQACVMPTIKMQHLHEGVNYLNNIFVLVWISQTKFNIYASMFITFTIPDVQYMHEYRYYFYNNQNIVYIYMFPAGKVGWNLVDIWLFSGCEVDNIVSTSGF